MITIPKSIKNLDDETLFIYGIYCAYHIVDIKFYYDLCNLMHKNNMITSSTFIESIIINLCNTIINRKHFNSKYAEFYYYELINRIKNNMDISFIHKIKLLNEVIL